jgi:hypothetical protein
MYTNLILNVLGVNYSDVLKKKHGSAREFTYGEVIDRIINNYSKPANSLFPEIGVQTFNRMISKAFPEVRLNGGKETWSFYILSLVSHKVCGICDSVLPFTTFAKDKGTSLGITSICKECKKLY